MGKTILVVDDFASIRQYICETLERKGYNTIGVANGDEAIDFLTTNPGKINLVISDYNMPMCTGIELLKKIKTNSTVKKIPVVFLTTETSPEKMKNARDAGLSAWIVKPYRDDAFFAQINNAINQS